MTLNELVELLYECDPNDEVKIPCPTGGDYSPSYIYRDDDDASINIT